MPNLVPGTMGLLSHLRYLLLFRNPLQISLEDKTHTHLKQLVDQTALYRAIIKCKVCFTDNWRPGQWSKVLHVQYERKSEDLLNEGETNGTDVVEDSNGMVHMACGRADLQARYSACSVGANKCMDGKMSRQMI